MDIDQIISRTAISNLDIIVSNDHQSQLQQLLLNAPNGRFRSIGLLERFAERYDTILRTSAVLDRPPNHLSHRS